MVYMNSVVQLRDGIDETPLFSTHFVHYYFPHPAFLADFGSFLKLDWLKPCVRTHTCVSKKT